MSILKGLKDIEREALVSFHVPGHKNGRLLMHLPFAEQITCYDTTEIPGTDNLHDPEGIILEAQRKAALYYGAKESFFMVNGTTGGIISMVYAAFQPGDKVIVSRDAHKSVFTGMILANLEPVYVTPEVDLSVGISLGITRELVENAYSREPNIKGVIVTYPNYHGLCTDLKGIEKVVHDNGGILLVDGAHGAHLKLHEKLPQTAISCGADIVVHSTHKSLPAFTQSSILHYCSDRVSLSKLKLALTMFQSSSPSYLLMASLENAIAVSEESGSQLMDALLLAIEKTKNVILNQTHFQLLDGENLPQGMTLDKTKLTLLTKDSGITGGLLDKKLREDYGIQCEYATDSAVLFITSIGTTEEDLRVLRRALVEISQEIIGGKSLADRVLRDMDVYDFKTFEIEQGLNPSQAIHGFRELVALKEAIGEVAGDFIVPYPPGVPIVVPGEVISEQVVNYIEEGFRKGYNINGVYFQKTLQVNIIRR